MDDLARSMAKDIRDIQPYEGQMFLSMFIDANPEHAVWEFTNDDYEDIKNQDIVTALAQEKCICENVMCSAWQIRMFVNAPKAYSKRKDIPDVRIRTRRYPATDPTIELVRTRSQPKRRAHLQRDRNRNVERIYNAMVSGDHARDNPKSTARKRWIEEPHYQSDLWEIARGRTRRVTVYEC
ncbi:uncharacterized protein J4E92_001459 [Alternaria infectoria]|uniref:uncharacterized protein n=1 Tax=Alternaria infectoria TaxID=45303 RepID=UPI00221F2538|nr:uncharacterized protein J4E92_001459 [Alternaria infectoria]KAI4936735.1 hypothetical protein J4E92_001459 [Alternaria infectoria]